MNSSLNIQNIDASLYNPPEFYIDPNDDNLLLGLPDDPANTATEDPAIAATSQVTTAAKLKGESETAEGKKDKSKIYENRAKLSKNLLGRSGVLNKDDQNNEIDSDSVAMKHGAPQQGTNDLKQFWNISNDDYYNPKVVVMYRKACVFAPLFLRTIINICIQVIFPNIIT